MSVNMNEKLGIQPELRQHLQTLGGVAIPWATPVNAVASTAILKVTTQPTAGETITIGGKVYTFVAAGTAVDDGEINLGALVADTRPLIVAAINGTDGINDLNPMATAGAFAGADSTLTASVAGVAGNSIVTDTDMVGADNEIADFAGGVDGTPGVRGAVCADASRLYICIANNTIADANWRRSPADWGALG